ncbi:MAG: hypothetical protein IPP91_11240 [Betaproteobacteria bacterium]|nr:hypothetical protein [Betaproteobacteria bacterium]
MTMQRSVAVNNARLDAVETTVGTAPKLRIYSGAQPANCAAARTGTLLCEITLPSDWMAAAAAAVKAKAGTWSGTGAAAGTAGHYAIMDTAGTNCHEQGSVTATGGGGDMTVDNTSIAIGQAVTVNTFQWTAGNQ